MDRDRLAFGFAPEEPRRGSDKFGGIGLDSLITAAGRALAAGDPLGALQRVALREDAAALALRGIAMAQLGDLERARVLLKIAGRKFQPNEWVAKARCVVAEAEIALVSRELSWPTRALDAARATLDAQGDPVNAAHARNLQIRRLLLIGDIDAAERMAADVDAAKLPPVSRAMHELVVADIAIRRLRAGPARAALLRASDAVRAAHVPALIREIEGAESILESVVARLITRGEERPLRLEDVERVMGSGAIVVDACRHVVRQSGTEVSLTTRPVLFALARLLAESWPGDVTRTALVAHAFRARQADESHRARLRVEIGRLRAALRPFASVHATARGFALVPADGREIVVLAPPVEEPHAALLALLADGEAWSSSALAIALGTSPRSVQRALAPLAAAGKVQSLGRGRARRWTSPPIPGFATALLLPGPLPSD